MIKVLSFVRSICLIFVPRLAVSFKLTEKWSFPIEKDQRFIGAIPFSLRAGDPPDRLVMAIGKNAVIAISGSGKVLWTASLEVSPRQNRSSRILTAMVTGDTDSAWGSWP